MKKNKKNEELQSRREFFKNAVKTALPILGTIVLAGSPRIVGAINAPMGCIGSCYGTCTSSCSRSCASNCHGMCKNGCFATSK